MTTKATAGSGNICQRSDGRWMGSISLGTGPDGKRRRTAVYGKTAKEVADKMKLALKELDAGVAIDSRKTLAEFLTAWLEDTIRPGIRATTYRSYRIAVYGHIIPGLGTVQLQKLTPQHIQKFLKDRLASGLTPVSVRYLHALLRRSLALAVKWSLLSKNPAALVDSIKGQPIEVKPLSIDEAKQLLATIKGNRLEALYVTALTLGLRPGEALGLTWADVDLDAGLLKVEGSLQRVEGRLQRLGTKTAKSRRTLPLPQIVVAALMEHRVRQSEERRQAGDAWVDSGMVFTSQLGTALDPRRVNRKFDRQLELAGLRHIRFHDLRHTAATLMLASGVPVKTVSEILGHASANMTLNVYAHVVGNMKQDAVDNMDRLLNSR